MVLNKSLTMRWTISLGYPRFFDRARLRRGETLAFLEVSTIFTLMGTSSIFNVLLLRFVFATAICRPRQKDGGWQNGTDLGSKVRTGIAV